MDLDAFYQMQEELEHADTGGLRSFRSVLEDISAAHGSQLGHD